MSDPLHNMAIEFYVAFLTAGVNIFHYSLEEPYWA